MSPEMTLATFLFFGLGLSALAAMLVILYSIIQRAIMMRRLLDEPHSRWESEWKATEKEMSK